MKVNVDDCGRVCLPSTATKEQARAFLDEFKKTPEGKEVGLHLDEDYTSLLNSPTLKATFERMGNVSSVTLATFCAIVRAMITTRDPSIFGEVAPATPVAPERPRNADGTFKGEFQVFADTHSMNEIRARANSDRAFGDWFRSQYNAQTITEAAYRVAGAAPEHPTTLVDRQRLGSFALAYQSTPIDRIRKPINGYVTLSNGERYRPEDLRQLVEEAGRVGLL